MNPKISKLKAERAKNDGKIAMLQSRNREIDEDIIKLENEDIVGRPRHRHDHGRTGTVPHAHQKERFAVLQHTEGGYGKCT